MSTPDRHRVPSVSRSVQDEGRTRARAARSGRTDAIRWHLEPDPTVSDAIELGASPVVIGSGGGCTIQLPGDAIGGLVSLRHRAGEVLIERHAAKADLSLDGRPVPRRIRVRATRAERVLSVAGSTFTLRCSSAAMDAGAGSVGAGSPRRGSPVRFAGGVAGLLIVALITMATVTVNAEVDDVKTEGHGATDPCPSGGCAASVPMRLPSGVSAIRTPDGRAVLTGVAHSVQECEAVDTWARAHAGQVRANRVTCLPRASEHVAMLLAGTGLTAEIQGHDLRIEGRGVDEPRLQRLMGTVRESFPELNLVMRTAPRDEPDPSERKVSEATSPDPAIERLLAAARGVVRGDNGRGMVMLADGRIVRSGDEIVPDVKVTAIYEDQVLTVARRAQHPISYAMVWRVGVPRNQ